MTAIEQLRQNFVKLKPKHKYEKKFKATYDYKISNPKIPLIIICIAIFAGCISVVFLPEKMMNMALTLNMIVLILSLLILTGINSYRYKNLNNSSKNIIGYGESSIMDILFDVNHKINHHDDIQFHGWTYTLKLDDPLSNWITTDIFMKYVVETPETIRLLNLKQLPNDIKTDLEHNIRTDLNQILDELIELNNKSIKNDKIIISDSIIQKSMAELNNLK